MRAILLAVLLAAMGASCGRGYDGANRSIVADLPSIGAIDLLDEDYYGFCSGDSCPFGNDRSGALLTYAVDTDSLSQESLVDAFRTALVDWSATIDETCANADPTFCDEVIVASFTKDGARIELNLDNWSGGQFELHVDAKGAP